MSVPTTSYFLFEASSVYSTGLFLNGFVEVEAASILMVIFLPFSLMTIVSSFFSPSFSQCFLSKASIFSLSSLLNIFSILKILLFGNLTTVKYQYTCAFTASFSTGVTVRGLICLFLCPPVVRHSADLLPTAYWSISMSGFIYICLRQRWG